MASRGSDAKQLTRSMSFTPKGTVQRSWFDYLTAIAFGITPIRSKEAKIKEWQMTATVCALMTGASGAGLFKAAGPGSVAIETYGNDIADVLSRWTVSSFCLTVFLFLTSSVTSAFFVTFALSTEADIFAIKRALGGAFWMPGAYFRGGYVFFVLSLCMFFVMHMDIFQMVGCVTFCSGVGIIPMFVAMGRAMSTIAAVDVGMGGVFIDVDLGSSSRKEDQSAARRDGKAKDDLEAGDAGDAGDFGDAGDAGD